MCRWLLQLSHVCLSVLCAMVIQLPKCNLHLGHAEVCVVDVRGFMVAIEPHTCHEGVCVCVRVWCAHCLLCASFTNSQCCTQPRPQRQPRPTVPAAPHSASCAHSASWSRPQLSDLAWDACLLPFVSKGVSWLGCSLPAVGAALPCVRAAHHAHL